MSRESWEYLPQPRCWSIEEENRIAARSVLMPREAPRLVGGFQETNKNISHWEN